MTRVKRKRLARKKLLPLLKESLSPQETLLWVGRFGASLRAGTNFKIIEIDGETHTISIPFSDTGIAASPAVLHIVNHALQPQETIVWISKQKLSLAWAHLIDLHIAVTNERAYAVSRRLFKWKAWRIDDITPTYFTNWELNIDAGE